jgi:hypothetical protein
MVFFLRVLLRKLFKYLRCGYVLRLLHHSWTYHPNPQGVWIMQLVILQLSLPYCYLLPRRSKLYRQRRVVQHPKPRYTPLCSPVYGANGSFFSYGNHVRKWTYVFLKRQKVGWPHAVSRTYKWIVLFECDWNATWIRPPRNVKLNERCFQHLIRCTFKWKLYTNRLWNLYSKESNDTYTQSHTHTPHYVEFLVKGSH